MKKQVTLCAIVVLCLVSSIARADYAEYYNDDKAAFDALPPSGLSLLDLQKLGKMDISFTLSNGVNGLIDVTPGNGQSNTQYYQVDDSSIHFEHQTTPYVQLGLNLDDLDLGLSALGLVIQSHNRKDENITVQAFYADGTLAGAISQFVSYQTGSFFGFSSTSDLFGSFLITVDDYQNGNAGMSVTVDFGRAGNATPEPGTMAIFGIGLAGAFSVMRRRNAVTK